MKFLFLWIIFLTMHNTFLHCWISFQMLGDNIYFCYFNSTAFPLDFVYILKKIFSDSEKFISGFLLLLQGNTKTISSNILQVLKLNSSKSSHMTFLNSIFICVSEHVKVIFYGLLLRFSFYAQEFVSPHLLRICFNIFISRMLFVKFENWKKLCYFKVISSFASSIDNKMWRYI